MSRNYSLLKPRKHFVYSVEDTMTLLDVSRNTVSNWVGQGLNPSDHLKPYLFRGAELRRFLKERQIQNHARLRIGQFKCTVCKARVFPSPETLYEKTTRNGSIGMWATCPECEAVVHKLVNESDRDTLLNCAITNTSVGSLDEGVEMEPARVVNGDTIECKPAYMANDRLVYEWLKYAGKYEMKTVVSHLAAIRDFEAALGGKCFKKIRPSEVAMYRDTLKARLDPNAKEPLSSSTIRHMASFLQSFFAWALAQKEFACLDRSILDYFDLPKKFDELALRAERPIPTIDEAERMIKAMPTETRKDRRDRAMVCIAFLGTLRADTVTTLRIEHFSGENRWIAQNGRQSRTKNGKSVWIHFFPLPQIFSESVIAWKAELVNLGFSEGDALFPSDTVLTEATDTARSEPIPVMTSTHAITKAFEIASGRVDAHWTPHAAKHAVGQLGLKKCRTSEEETAWSKNMGHQSGEVTRKYYQNLSSDRIGQIFEVFDRPDFETMEDKELIIRFLNQEVDRSMPEFRRAHHLVETRRKRLRVASDIFEET